MLLLVAAYLTYATTFEDREGQLELIRHLDINETDGLTLLIEVETLLKGDLGGQVDYFHHKVVLVQVL